MSNIIERLLETIKERKGRSPETSYTSFLLSKGNNHCLNKLKEEVEELKKAIENQTNTVHESADVIYHLLVTLESAGINFKQVLKELEKREGTSGFKEKASR